MLKELKNVFFVVVILTFVFLILRFYFSDDNKKKSYRSLKKNDEKISQISKTLILLENDTSNIIEYIKKNKNKNKKNYNFWELIKND
jgi:hypothetical protein|tara:strand:+ start:314 stop:574 length:261 start_codon:yes stop_codon:yes gene_type:complete